MVLLLLSYLAIPAPISPKSPSKNFSNFYIKSLSSTKSSIFAKTFLAYLTFVSLLYTTETDPKEPLPNSYKNYKLSSSISYSSSISSNYIFSSSILL